MLSSLGGVSGIRGNGLTLPARLGQRSVRPISSKSLVCRAERTQGTSKQAGKVERSADSPNGLAVPVAAAALAGLLLSSAVVMPEEAFAARSSGRVGGSSFRSSAPSGGGSIRLAKPPAASPRQPQKRSSRPPAPRMSKPALKSDPKPRPRVSKKDFSVRARPPVQPNVSAQRIPSPRASESIGTSRSPPVISRGGAGGGGNSYRGGNTYNSYTVAPSIGGGYGGGYYPGGFGGGITVFPSFYSPPVMGVALPLGVMFNLMFTLFVVGAAFAVIKSIFTAVTRGGGGSKKDEWD